MQGDVRSHANWEASRPPAWESEAIAMLLDILEVWLQCIIRFKFYDFNLNLLSSEAGHTLCTCRLLN